MAGWYPSLPPAVDAATATADDALWRLSPLPSVGDAMDADVAYFEAAIRAPLGWTVVTTGSEVSHEAADTAVDWRFVSGPAREFVMVAGPDMSPLTVSAGDVLVHYYARRPSGAMSAMDGAEAARSALITFEDVFGACPYRELDVIETDITIGGYEFPGVVMVDEATRVSGSPQEALWLIAHELAHQWWYGIVGSPTVLLARRWLCHLRSRNRLRAIEC